MTRLLDYLLHRCKRCHGSGVVRWNNVLPFHYSFGPCPRCKR